MEITEVESVPISIPLSEPVSFATRTVEHRDHAVTFVRTEDGYEGVGYTLGYDGAGLIADAVEELLAPMLVGQNPHHTTDLWQRMFEGTYQIGRKGLLLRAIATIDIALWDIRAKAAGLPLHEFIGAARESVPAYASGGYYRGEGVDGLREEMETYLDRGHVAVKMKVGRRSLETEEKRVAAAREVLGPERTLMLDANGAWTDTGEALRACRRFAPYDPYFIEEPVKADSVELMARVREGLDYPLAAGELEFSRYGFAELLRAGAVDVVQPDATVCGGITEWLRVAHTAASHDIPVVPHYNPHLHAHLVASVENGGMVEYFYRDRDIKVFDDLIVNPPTPEDGKLTPRGPGHGVRIDRSALAEFRTDGGD
ncbi:mandelate racemase/muconate lactonizing enzyme family protein [Halobaculum limi]|uniref:mandelate racemase/muconate lactonizing enzyme family protein n=1 Tax=Halobaculum limi TaxID=3031916 RepID=UPI002406205D|nr:mandelate racemase/muconate lactonizing enzyme family protein [Halobaculum sp. YSMS11]